MDIAKDPYIAKGNWTTSTTNVGNMLLRLGAHPLYVVNFLANDVITQYVNFQKSKEGLTENEPGDMFEAFKSELVVNNLNSFAKKNNYKFDLGAFYKNSFEKLNIEERINSLDNKLNKGYISKQEYDEQLVKINNEFEKTLKGLNNKLKIEEEDLQKVRKSIIEIHDAVFNHKKLNIFDRTTFQYNKFKLDLKFFRNQNKIKNKNEDALMFQINLLETFKELVEYSKNLGETVKLSKIDTDGFGKDHNELFGIFNLYEQVIDKELNNNKGAIRGFNTKLNNTTLGVYWNQLEWVKNVVEANPLLFPSGMSQVKNMFNEISNDLYDKSATDSEMLTDLSKHYNSYLMNKFFNLTAEQSKELLNNLPKRLETFKNEVGEKYFMLNELNVKTYKNNKYDDSIQMNNRKKSKSYDKLFTNSWKDLFIDNPILAEDLVKYSFITSGFQMNTNQFFTFIPSEYFSQNNINREIQKISKENNYDFIDKFYMNNLANKKYVKSVREQNVYNLEEDLSTFTLKKDGNAKRYLELSIPRSKEADPLVKQEKYYYKLIGYNTEGQGMYSRIKDTTNKLNDKSLITYTDFQEVKPEVKPVLDVQTPQVTEFVPTDIYDEISAEDLLATIQYGGESMYVEPITKSVETTENVETETVNNQSQIKFEEEQTSGYKNRTIKNASADVTIAIAVDFNTAGEKLTKSSVLNQNKLYLPVSTDIFSSANEVTMMAGKLVSEIIKINKKEISLNIAGNGIYSLKNTFPGGQSSVDNFTLELLTDVNNRLKEKGIKIILLRSGGQTGFDEAGNKFHDIYLLYGCQEKSFHRS